MDMNDHQSLMNVMNRIVTLLPPNIIMNNIQPDVLDMSFQNQKETIKPTDQEFIDSLKVTELTEDSEESCCICFDNFVKGDKVVTLPCDDHQHTFHYSDTHNCSGILPWLSVQNTCPICRSEFPLSKENVISESASLTEETHMNASSTEDTIEITGYIMRHAVDENASTVDENASTVNENASTVDENASTVNENASTVDENASDVRDRQREDMIRAMLDLLHHIQPPSHIQENIDEEGFFENDVNEAIRRSLE
jgi:hypothetical protein